MQGNQLEACWYRPGKKLRGQNSHHFTCEKTKAQHIFITYLLVEGYHLPIQINLLSPELKHKNLEWGGHEMRREKKVLNNSRETYH